MKTETVFAFWEKVLQSCSDFGPTQACTISWLEELNKTRCIVEIITRVCLNYNIGVEVFRGV